MSIPVVEEDSPLEYKHSYKVLRFAAYDAEAPPTKQAYYKDHPGLLSFIDWHRGPYGVEIDYLNTRTDFTGLGLASILVEMFYEKNANEPEINWGRIVNDHAEKIFRKMNKKFKTPRTRGKLF